MCCVESGAQTQALCFQTVWLMGRWPDLPPLLPQLRNEDTELSPGGGVGINRDEVRKGLAEHTPQKALVASLEAKE